MVKSKWGKVIVSFRHFTFSIFYSGKIRASLSFESNYRNAKLIIPVFFPKMVLISNDFSVKRDTVFILL